MKIFTIKLLSLLPLLFIASYAYAHIPVLVAQKDINDITVITEPEISRSFYGELQNFPHTYQIEANEPFRLKVAILVPDIEEAKANVSGIIIREIEGGGRVEEIARLAAKQAAWESKYEPFGGDRYRIGSSFDEEVNAGVYRIEVSTPDNVEKYVLTVGYLEENDIGYFETLKRIAAVKTFFNKSQLLIVQSPFVYIPLVLLVFLIGFSMYRRMKKSRNSVV